VVNILCFGLLQSMCLCALEWDKGGGMLRTIVPAYDHHLLLKGKGASVQQERDLIRTLWNWFGLRMGM
jgi:hypothetical protein